MNKNISSSKTIKAGTTKLFLSPTLEKLSRTHIAVPISIFIGYALSILVWSASHTTLSLEKTIVFILIGLIFFTWVEYNVHRYIFHIPTTTVRREKLQYTIHGVHHEFPKDRDRLAMPPLLSVAIATVLLLLFRATMGDYAFAFMPGFFIGYALYLFVHYLVHAYSPPKNFFKVLWRNHAMHHYKDSDSAFGVSSPLWDYIYGTMPKSKSDL